MYVPDEIAETIYHELKGLQDFANRVSERHNDMHYGECGCMGPLGACPCVWKSTKLEFFNKLVEASQK